MLGPSTGSGTLSLPILRAFAGACGAYFLLLPAAPVGALAGALLTALAGSLVGALPGAAIVLEIGPSVTPGVWSGYSSSGVFFPG